MNHEVKTATEKLYTGISPLNPNHPAYGICPQCGSSHTLVRDHIVERLCLSCDFTESFQNYDIAQTGWRPFYQQEIKAFFKAINPHPPLKRVLVDGN